MADQRNDPESLLSFMRLLIRRYRESPELGWSEFQPLDQPHRDVLVHLCEQDERRLVAVHNLATEGRAVHVHGGRLRRGHAARRPAGGRLVDPAGAGGRVELSLDGYGSRWLRLHRPGDRRLP